MKLEDLKIAKNLESSISYQKHNLEKYKIFKDAEEIRISITAVDSKQQPIFITGERKRLMIDVLIKDAEARLKDKCIELEKL